MSTSNFLFYFADARDADVLAKNYQDIFRFSTEFFFYSVSLQLPKAFMVLQMCPSVYMCTFVFVFFLYSSLVLSGVQQ